MRALTSLFFAGIATIAAACGGGSDGPSTITFGATPIVTIQTTAGLTVDVRTGPAQPPTRGEVTADLLVTDASGKPVDDLTLVVVPYMPAMGHGASVKPFVTPKGDGHYEVSQLELFMPGRWELQTTISGKAADHAAPALDVQ